MAVLNGIDQLEKKDFGLKNLRLGLVTSPTGVSVGLKPSIDVLLDEGFNLTALYSPEHGVRGDVAAGDTVCTYTDERTGLPVYSLYGANNSPEEEMLKQVDAVLMDVQDIGCRYYTYISTMRNMMEVCAKMDKMFVVLDRPNPIGADVVQGNKLDIKFKSFVGIAPIPQRHGMTMGELAKMFNREYQMGCKVQVVPVLGWRRNMCQDETGLIWVNPSPNIPCVDAALLYPGTCLLEGTNLSEGRGTTKPFEMLGAPWLNAEKMAEDLNAKKMGGVLFRPVYFRPTASKHAGCLCPGVQAHITNRKLLQPIEIGLNILQAAQEQGQGLFKWLEPNQKEKHFFIDLLLGTDSLRLSWEPKKYLENAEKESAQFKELRREYLLYD